MNLKLTREELWDLVEQSEHVDTDSWKWGTRESYVCERDGKHFRFTVEMHSQDGLQHYGSVDLAEVRRVEKAVVVWEPA